MDADRIRHPDDCKHNNLIVQRNYGRRWVSCEDCLSDFIRLDYLDGPTDEEIEALDQWMRGFLGRHFQMGTTGRFGREVWEAVWQARKESR